MVDVDGSPGLARPDSVSSPARPRDRAEEDFRTLFTTAYPRILHTVALVTGDRSVAEEVTQEAFVQLLLHWRKVSRYERPDLWVRRVAIRRAQRERHRDRRRGELEQVLPPPPAAVTTEPDDEVRRAVATLPPGQRAVVALFYFEDLAMTDIAELLGCSTSTGWSQLHTARRKLAAMLQEEVGDDVDR